MTDWITCKAGFKHRLGEVCTHIVVQTEPKVRRVPYKLPPDHDTVVVNDQGQVTRSYKSSGFYSDEATAARRLENKTKYMPGWQREALADQRRREEKAAAKANGEFMGVEA